MLRNNDFNKYYISFSFRNSYGSEVHDEEVEAYYVETISDEEESNKATASSSQSIERTGVVEVNPFLTNVISHGAQIR